MHFFRIFSLKNLHMCWNFRTFAPYLGIMRFLDSFRGESWALVSLGTGASLSPVKNGCHSGTSTICGS